MVTLEERIFLGLATFLTCISLAALLLAELRIFSGLLSLLLALPATGALIWGTVARRSGPSVIDRPFLVALIVYACLFAFLALPPFPWIVGGVDPGSYLNMATSISHTGEIGVKEPILAQLEGTPYLHQFMYGGTAVPAFYYVDKAIEFQFYHLYPAFLAVPYAFFGLGGLFYGTSILAFLSGLGLYFFARRCLESHWAALAALLFFIGNVSFIWFSRTPNSDVHGLFLLLTACLALSIAERKELYPTPWFVLAGILTAALFLSRIDAVYLIPAFALAFALLRLRGKTKGAGIWALIAGLGLGWSVLHAARYSSQYVRDTMHIQLHLPPAAVQHQALLWAFVIFAAIVFLTAWWMSKSHASAPFLQRAIGWIQVWALPLWGLLIMCFAAAYFLLQREAVHWLVWYTGAPMVGLAALGVLALAQGSRDEEGLFPAAFWLLASGALVWLSMLAVKPIVTVVHFWASRRLLMVVFPAVAILAALGLRFVYQRYGRLVSAMLFISALMPLVVNARSVVGFVQYKGVPEDVAAIADAVPDTALLLAGPDGYAGVAAGTPLQFMHGKQVLSFREPTLSRETIDFLRQRFSSSRLFLLVFKDQLPVIEPPYYPSAAEFALPIEWPLFEHRNDRLPTRRHSLKGRFNLWEILRSSDDSVIPIPIMAANNGTLQLSGFSGIERLRSGVPFRWTTGDVHLLIPVNWIQGAKYLHIRAQDNRPNPVHTEIYLEGKLIARVQIHEPQDIKIAVPPRALLGKSKVKLEFRTPPWVPKETIGSADTRELGIMVYDVSFSRN